MNRRGRWGVWCPGNEVDAATLLENDPFPPWCGPANGKPAPAPPSGTEQCPSDKNVEGCPCNTLGEEASCWPGKRKNRDIGICHDGRTRCISAGEVGKVWSKCEGAQLPMPGATGKNACSCFSGGSWKIDNTTPCFVTSSGGSYATSAACTGSAPPKTVPAAPWSTNTLTVDCEGHFKLCYSVKSGDIANPSATDCTVFTTCTEADYITKDVPQTMPALPGWLGTDGACVDKVLGGAPLYGEMSVVGKSVMCDVVDDGAGQPYVFHRVKYCAFGDATCTTGQTADF